MKFFINIFPLKNIQRLRCCLMEADQNAIHQLFLTACSAGKLIIVKTLIKFFEIDITYNDDQGFRSACQKNRVMVARYLVKLNPDYKIVVEKRKIIEYHIFTKPLLIPNKITLSEEEKKNIYCLYCHDQEDLKEMFTFNCSKVKHYMHLKCANRWYRGREKICLMCREEFAWENCLMIEESV